MTILDERGLFWRHSEPVPKRQFAPDACAPGQLIVDQHGISHLELDGNLPGEDRSFFPKVGFDPALQGISIQGILKGNNRHVVLCELRRDGGLGNTAGPSYVRYLADSCIVSDIAVPDGEDISRIGSLQVNLKGFEEWLGLQSIEARTEPDGGMSVTYHKQDDVVRESFGAIFARWKEQRDKLGPAIYLYLGLRRGQPNLS